MTFHQQFKKHKSSQSFWDEGQFPGELRGAAQQARSLAHCVPVIFAGSQELMMVPQVCTLLLAETVNTHQISKWNCRPCAFEELGSGICRVEHRLKRPSVRKGLTGWNCSQWLKVGKWEQLSGKITPLSDGNRDGEGRNGELRLWADRMARRPPELASWAWTDQLLPAVTTLGEEF